MSSTSLIDLNTKYLTKSLSQNDSSQESDSYSNSIRSTENKSSIGSIEKNSICEKSMSTTRSIKIKISPISTAGNSVDEKIDPSTDLKDMKISAQLLQTETDSFNSHKHLNYNNKIIEERLNEDLQLRLEEEQDFNFNVCGNNNLLCNTNGPQNNRDPVENLVSATLAFKEASNNQCDLLRAQTSAINRLATAIEEQNVMMNRFHNTVVQKTNPKHSSDDDNSLREDK